MPRSFPTRRTSDLILHTSGGHLGRSFHREGLLGHQAAYADHLLDVVESEKVDLVVVSGDIYDRALPPVDAVRLANETFPRIARSRAHIVVPSGHHDSAHSLGFCPEPAPKSVLVGKRMVI